MDMAEADVEKTTTDCAVYNFMARQFYFQNEFYDVFFLVGYLAVKNV